MTAGAGARTWAVLYRPRKARGVRWRAVAEGLTHSEAVGVIVAGERGEYWLTDQPETESKACRRPSTTPSRS